MTIAERRRELGLTQQAAAAMAGVVLDVWVMWETGRSRPLPRRRPRLAATLAVSDEELLVMLAKCRRRERPAAARLREQLERIVNTHRVTLVAIRQHLGVAYSTMDNWRRGNSTVPDWVFERLADFAPEPAPPKPQPDCQCSDEPHQLNGQDVRLMLMRWRGSEGRRSEPTGGVTPYAELAASDAAWGGA